MAERHSPKECLNNLAALICELFFPEKKPVEIQLGLNEARTGEWELTVLHQAEHD